VPEEIIIAIDPGRSGGFAVKDSEGIRLYPMPENEFRTVKLIDSIAPREQSVRAVIEHVGSLGPGDPLKGQRLFNFGRGYGFLRGAVIERQIPLTHYRPQVWQKSLGITSKGQERKRELKERALSLYPELAKQITLKTCDALLLLNYELTQCQQHKS